MKKYTNISGFTLVEVLVAMTILALVMVSIMGIYASSVQIALKTDINREMQQNIKSIVETIAEDVRKNNIKAVSSAPLSYGLSDRFNTGSALEVGDTQDDIGTGEFNRYYLVSKESLEDSDPLTPRIIDIGECDIEVDAENIKNICILAKFDQTGKLIGPLSNSKITISNLQFSVSSGPVPKLTINFIARAAIKNGLRPDIVKNSTLNFQTTISERNLQVK